MEKLLRDMYQVLLDEPLISFAKGLVSLAIVGVLLAMIIEVIEDTGAELDDIFKGCLVIIGIIILSMLCGAFLTALFGGLPQ